MDFLPYSENGWQMKSMAAVPNKNDRKRRLFIIYDAKRSFRNVLPQAKHYTAAGRRNITRRKANITFLRSKKISLPPKGGFAALQM